VEIEEQLVTQEMHTERHLVDNIKSDNTRLKNEQNYVIVEKRGENYYKLCNRQNMDDFKQLLQIM